MLHDDMKKTMTEEEVINLAYAEYEPKFDATAEFQVKIKSDDGGKTIDFFVVGEENAEYLRDELKQTYNGYRTIVVYRSEMKIKK